MTHHIVSVSNGDRLRLREAYGRFAKGAEIIVGEHIAASLAGQWVRDGLAVDAAAKSARPRIQNKAMSAPAPAE